MFSARPLIMIYIGTRFVKISQRVSELLSGHDFHSEIFKGGLFRKNEGGVEVFILCISSEDTLYLFKNFLNKSSTVFDM